MYHRYTSIVPSCVTDMNRVKIRQNIIENSISVDVKYTITQNCKKKN